MDHELRHRRTLVERARAHFDPDAEEPAVRNEVRASWLRCAPTLPVAQAAAPVDDAGALGDRWAASPIRRAVPDLADQLTTVAAEGDLVAAVTDEDGTILWSSGGRTMRDRAASVNFTTGGRWDEASAGTNALGLALISGRPETVFSAEHWCTGVQDWVCYSAPVHDPDGRALGVIDLSTTWERSTPLALATVAALARVAEHELRDRPRAAPVGLQLRVLGHPTASVGGVDVALSLRQVEILTVLAVVGPCSLDELHAHLYGDRPVSATTLRAEISHLRRLLGGAIASRPYRLTVPVESDLVGVLDAVSAGDLEAASQRFGAQLLVASEAPLLVERRHHLDVALRTALLASGTGEQLVRFARVHPADVEVIDAAVARSSAGSGAHAAAVALLAAALDPA